DAAATGAGVVSETLDLDPLLAYVDDHVPNPTPFRQWVARAEGIAVGAIEEAAGVLPLHGDGARQTNVVTTVASLAASRTH
ncbi:MAG: hypothetical protein AAGK21_15560, partial [Bacteroidota bacterium]